MRRFAIKLGRRYFATFGKDGKTAHWSTHPVPHRLAEAERIARCFDNAEIVPCSAFETDEEKILRSLFSKF